MNNRFFIAVVLLSLAIEARAQTRVEAGYVHVESENRFDSADWQSVDRGRGGQFTVAHDRGPLQIGLQFQRLNLDHRNSEYAIGCINNFCNPIERYYEFTDRYRSYEVSGT